jgi:hypothetical protein
MGRMHSCLPFTLFVEMAGDREFKGAMPHGSNGVENQDRNDSKLIYVFIPQKC